MNQEKTVTSMSQMCQHMPYMLSVKSLAESGVFYGYASVFDTPDNQKDIMCRGAFSQTLLAAKRDVKLLWQHQSSEPIGVIEELKEDARGLLVRGRLLLDVARAREAYSLMKAGALNGLSIGYTVQDYDLDHASGCRLLKNIDLWEISLVTFPANDEARVTQIKSDGVEKNEVHIPQTIREFEHFLNQQGFSRRRAKEIALKGFAPEISANEMRQWKAAYQSGDVISMQDAIERAMHTLLA